MLWMYLQAWLVTVLVEAPVVAVLFPGQRLRMAGVCLLVTTASHAGMHFVLPYLAPTLEVWVVVGEVGATVVEAIAYACASRPRSIPRALAASALANGLSFGAGLAFFP